MEANSNVSVAKIQQGVDYIENEFVSPLTKVGIELIDQYKELNNVLKSDTINRLIAEQQNKLDEVQADLKDIMDKAKNAMDDSSRVISNNQNNVDESLSGI